MASTNYVQVKDGGKCKAMSLFLPTFQVPLRAPIPFPDFFSTEYLLGSAPCEGADTQRTYALHDMSMIMLQWNVSLLHVANTFYCVCIFCHFNII